METPFVFGRLAVDRDFTDREAETAQLVANFTALVNTILISPRRWGKSSLVQKAADEVRRSNKEVHFCFVDAFNVRTEEQFYQALATEVLKESASGIELLLGNARAFMGRFLPRLSFNPDNLREVSLSLDWKEVKKQPDDILDMAEKIAVEKNWKLVICIDEFQNVSSFENPLAFQKKLRSHWQKHQHTAYCLYGSKRHMLTDVFTNSSMPFYKFGDLLFLNKIKEADWIEFISKRFRETKKKITKSNAARIARLVECHPYYVQQLAQQSWIRTPENCTEEIIDEAHQGMIYQLSLLFYSKTDELTNPQINFLKALIEGVEKFSSKEVLNQYELGTSANVGRIKKALENKEIINIQSKAIQLLDPLYKSWLESNYFKTRDKTYSKA